MQSFRIGLAWIKSNEYLCAALLLAAMTVLVYSDVVFLGYSLSPATYNAGVTPLGPYGYEGRKIAELPVIDPMAVGQHMWPLHRLVIQYLFAGKVPLWNPYLAAGTPLAADTTFSAYAPTVLLGFLPSELWDLRVLVRFWLAGLFAYIFLREIKLRKPSAFTGAVLYALSGSFTWYSTADWIDVAMLTPFILFSVEKLAQKPCPRHVCLCSVTLALSLLSAHIESIVLQFTLVVLYFAFRVSQARRKDIWKHLLGLVSSSLGGFGLSAFFLLPVFEYLANASMSHVGGEGLAALPALAAVTSFIPYFLGGVQTYWSPSIAVTGVWNSLGGYVGVSCLFLSTIAILSPAKETYDKRNKQIGTFFFVMGAIALFKTYGGPPLNWIGYLPVFDRIAFTRYLGPIWTVSFAIAAAFGVEALILKWVDKKRIVAAFFTALLVTLSLASIDAPYLLSIYRELISNLFHGANIPYPLAEQAVRAFYCALGGLVQASVFLFTIALISNSVLDNKDYIYSIVLIVILEMSSYVPLGLHPYWQAIRGLAVLLGLLIIVIAILFSSMGSETSILRKIPQFFSRRIVIRRSNILPAIMLCTIIIQSLIGSVAPMGLPQRYDQFKEAPYIAFLHQKAGLHRVYSFDGVLPPDFSGVFGLQSVGIMSAFNVRSFASFVVNNLDSGVILNMFVSNQWYRNPKAPGPVTELQRNIRFYNLLGVKYIITNSTDPNSALEIVGGNVAVPIDRPGNYILGQSFYSPVDDFSSIAIQLGTYGRVNHGSIILTLDSVPYDERSHRTAVVPAEDVLDNWPPTIFNFRPIDDSLGKQFYFNLQFLEANSTNAIAVWSYDDNHPYAPVIRSLLKGQMYKEGKLFGGTMAFTISSNHFRLVYSDGIAKIYENPTAFPRAFIVHRFQVASSFEEAQDILKNLNFNLREEVVLDATLPDSEVEALEQMPVADGSTAEIIRYEPDRVIIKAYAEHPGLLVLTDTYYPGWKAYMDDKPVTIYQADGLVRAVYLSQGEHVVEFIYSPESFKIGLTITFVSVVALLTLVMMEKFKMLGRKKNSAHDR